MRTSRELSFATEAALALVTLAGVLGMARLFEGGGWLGPLALNAVLAHVVASALRRRGLSLAVAAAATSLAAFVSISWISYRATTVLGIPAGGTWAQMSSDLGGAWSLYQDVVAPAPVEPGFVLASAIAVWIIGFVADWAAFRLWVPFEATLPAGTLFLFTALLGTDRGRGWAVAAFAGSVLVFVLLHRLARQDGTSHWVADRRTSGHRSLLGAGAGLAVVAVVAGSVLGPSVPGADSVGVLDPRNLREGEGSRVTISPLVDIRTRLVDQADVEVFTVRSPVPSYWRLTSLERFDGRIWSSSGSFGRADGELPRAVDDDVAAATFEQTFTIGALSAIWLPSAYEPRALVTDGLPVRYDEQSATLIVDNDVPTSDGLVYEVTSASPRLDPALLAAAGEVPDDIRDRYLALPEDFSPAVVERARQVTETATNPYEQARQLQDYLRGFEYDLEIGPGHDDNALETFLFETQRGYCEQFAGAFAAMARVLGLPSRVAVGFTQGEPDPVQPDLYRVRGEHAHAWPEVYLSGAGWVAFEPTPGRGMPFAEAYTGVAPAQATTSDPGSATTSPPTIPEDTRPTTPGGAAPRDPDAGLDTGAPDPQGADAASGGTSAAERYLLGPAKVVVPAAGAALAAYLILVPLGLLARRALRRRRAADPAERIEVAWAEIVEEAGVLGYQETRSDTLRERAEALGQLVPAGAGEAALLAGHLEVSRYAPAGADDGAVDEVLAARLRFAQASRAATPAKARLRRHLDLGPLVRTWRDERASGQRRITTTARGDMEAERALVR